MKCKGAVNPEGFKVHIPCCRDRLKSLVLEGQITSQQSQASARTRIREEMIAEQRRVIHELQTELTAMRSLSTMVCLPFDQ